MYSLYYTDDEEQLKNILNRYNKNKSLEYKCLPNFLNLNQEVLESNNLVSTLWAMLNYQSQPITRQLLIDQLQKLILTLEKQQWSFSANQSVFKQFIKELRQGQLDCNRCIYWYTLESPIFKLVNNLLRSTNDSSLLFYIQPYFKNLFNMIETLHKKQKNRVSFTCYRGSTMSCQQVQRFQRSIGGYIQNLGFLSTSLQREVSKTYMKNVMVEIIVDGNGAGKHGFSFGYASISEHSHYFEESQILFNPLNIFYVLSMKERSSQNISTFEIKLRYENGFQHQQPSTSRKKIFQLFLSKQSRQRTKQTIQGQTFQGETQHFRQMSQTFWAKFIEIAKTKSQSMKNLRAQICNANTLPNQKENSIRVRAQQNFKLLTLNQQISLQKLHFIKGLTEIASGMEANYQLERALVLYAIIQQQLTKQQDERSLLWVPFFQKIAQFYSTIKNYKKCIQLYQRLQRIILKNFGDGHPRNAQLMMEIALALLDMNEVVQAQRFFQKSNEIYQSLGLRDMYNPKYLFTIARFELLKGNIANFDQISKRLETIIQNTEGFSILYFRILEMRVAVHQAQGFTSNDGCTLSKVLQLKQAYYGKQHPEIAITLSLRANYLHAEGEILDALDQYQKANEMLRSFNQTYTDAFLNNLVNIGDILKKVGRPNDSLGFYLEARQIAAKIYDQGNQVNIGLLENITAIYLANRHFIHALDFLKIQQKIAQKNFSKRSYQEKQWLKYLQILKNKCEAYKNLGHLSQLLITYKKALKIMKFFKVNSQGSVQFYKIIIKIYNETSNQALSLMFWQKNKHDLNEKMTQKQKKKFQLLLKSTQPPSANNIIFADF